MNFPRKRVWLARILTAAAVICALAVALLIAGCSSASPPVGGSPDRKAMMETAAKWWVAEDAQDLKGIKAAIHDPSNILGIATETASASVEPTSAFTWKWDGSNIVMIAPSQDTTVTVVNLSATPNTVDLYQSGGQGVSLIMTKVDGVWKIDVTATQKAIDDAAAKQSGGESLPPGTVEEP